MIEGLCYETSVAQEYGRPGGTSVDLLRVAGSAGILLASGEADVRNKSMKSQNDRRSCLGAPCAGIGQASIEMKRRFPADLSRRRRDEPNRNTVPGMPNVTRRFYNIYLRLRPLP